MLTPPPDQRIVLMEKRRPSWQRNRYNGPGGHIEAGESRYAAMIREAEEETGVITTADDWRHTIELVSVSRHNPQNDSAIISFLMMQSARVRQARTLTDEPVVLMPLADMMIDDRVLGNLRWIVQLSLDPQTMPGCRINFPVLVREQQQAPQADYYISRR
jgi:ADP-ribose pyrophosphatase YjhB (NUDIX family)